MYLAIFLFFLYPVMPTEMATILSLGRAGFLAKLLVAEGQFLVWGTRRGPAFFRFRVGSFAPWLGILLFLPTTRVTQYYRDMARGREGLTLLG
jgi:hypothetical protein